MIIQGQFIPPYSQITIDIPITDLSDHTPITMPIHVIRGKKEGPKLFICAAIHGDEINGVEIIRRLLTYINPVKINGTIIAVPIVNVMGFISGSRYLPDRRDLNRSFPGSKGGSLAARLANLFLTEVVSQCEYGIDLHTGALHKSNYPQIRANLDDPKTEDLALKTGIPVIINTGFREGSLRESAASLNVPVLVYEGGEALRYDEIAIKTGVKIILQLLQNIGSLKKKKTTKKSFSFEPAIARSSSWIRAPKSGVMREAVDLGQVVQKDDVLGIISNPFGDKEIIITSPDQGIIIGKTNLPLIHEGDGLFHLVKFSGTQCPAIDLEEYL